ncbi:hypothetical protein LJR219_002350 [Phenylobacterium sp. LjRoot219]|uniref:hypothetical protein n=1 Tax=Phenylobacterium sp. LjRoot219 TaxID=3342283 RepID=UPI003ECFD543
MRPITLALCAGFAFAPFAAVAAAPAAGGATGDARCLMTMAAISGSQDANQARLGQVGVVYFAGRVKAQDPSFDFATRLKPIADAMNRDAINQEVQRCGPLLTNTLRELDNAQKAFPAQKPAAGAGGAAPAKPPAGQTPPKR